MIGAFIVLDLGPDTERDFAWPVRVYVCKDEESMDSLAMALGDEGRLVCRIQPDEVFYQGP